MGTFKYELLILPEFKKTWNEIHKNIAIWLNISFYNKIITFLYFVSPILLPTISEKNPRISDAHPLLLQFVWLKFFIIQHSALRCSAVLEKTNVVMERYTICEKQKKHAVTCGRQLLVMCWKESRELTDTFLETNDTTETYHLYIFLNIQILCLVIAWWGIFAEKWGEKTAVSCDQWLILVKFRLIKSFIYIFRAFLQYSKRLSFWCWCFLTVLHCFFWKYGVDLCKSIQEPISTQVVWSFIISRL